MSQKIYHAGSGNYIHYCPGCEQLHRINTGAPNLNNAIWTFDGNYDMPTFKPSVDINRDIPSVRCHYNIVAGEIIYTADCYHSLRGQNMNLPEIPEGWL